ncbi:Sugar-specific transcriptional regulator TrmB [Halopenitus malekzadehii]|uniref:Sugar-specific transcriptional regulator TrmB n=1 Tax=Halopenitus malekzadehii TaxID=1267564 RepID=A0A1H6HY67_9EURY|nr:helix-turn-helix domain-containing protein [Halopenitus malekzadehii]SEH40676.1 Sugar-specific transcriptional regulator TrmB [Halopenitus malekzadehii]
MATERDPSDLLATLDRTEYEERALERLLELGRTTAPDLSEATGIPKARIYGVLDELADAGYIKVIPGRPKQYQPKPPATILDRAVENRRQSYESYRAEIESVREEFLETLGPLYERASEDISPTEELFHVVDVGDPSEAETRSLYRGAAERVDVLTKSFEYLESVEPTVADAIDRGRDLRVLFLDPSLLSAENAAVQERTVARLREEYPDVAVRFSATRLPWRGTIADPSMAYDSGRAVLLVEEEEIPLHKRQAAVTENPSFVAGLERYFQLTWEYDTLAADPYS